MGILYSRMVAFLAFPRPYQPLPQLCHPALSLPHGAFQSFLPSFVQSLKAFRPTALSLALGVMRRRPAS